MTSTDTVDTDRGFDGSILAVGDRIELHPGCDLWMRGARFGEIVGRVPTRQDRFRVRLDKTGPRLWSCPPERLRLA